MRITKIKLQNFLGLYNGSGKKEIEIDFSRGLDNKITILSGGNGKGKSFLLSCLHPFASTLDNRSKIIMDGENGYKEIHYDINDDEKVIIKHNYLLGRTGKISMKSFFQLSTDGGKTYKELNPNGTVGSFKELVLKYLEVDESYFKIARVGTNVTNFIDMSTAERKKYISLFLPDVDIYLENYKIINEKYNTLNKTIKFITGEIDKIDTEENINSNLTNIENSLSLVKTSLNETNSLLSKNLGIISTIDPNGEKEKQFLDYYNEYNSIKPKIEKLNEDIKLLDESIETKDINKVEYKLGIANVNIDNKKEKLANLRHELSEIDSVIEENEIKRTKIEIEDEDEIKNILETINERIEFVNMALESSDLSKFEKYSKNISKSDIEVAIQTLDYYKEQTNNITSEYDLNLITEYRELKTLPDVITEEVKTLRNKINKINSTLSDYKVSKHSMISKLELLDVLDKRPSGCKIDSCPFISKALENKHVEEDIKVVESSINETESKLTKLNNELNHLTNRLNFVNSIMGVFKFIQMHDDILSKLPHYEYFKSYDSFVDHILKDKDLLSYTEIKNIIELKEELSDLKYSKSNLELKLDNMNNKKIIIESIDSEIKRLVDKKKTSSESISKLEKEIYVLINEVKCLKMVKDYLNRLEKLNNELNELIKTRKELKPKLVSLKNDINQLKELKKENKELTEKIKKLEVQQEPLEKQRDNLKVELKRLQNFVEKRKLLEVDYKDIATIRDSLSATKGIPLLFIDLYLKKIKNIANDLLDITFKGEFFIEDFVITESDFFISVRKAEGELVNDISQASQGEQALTSIALSFALVQQSTREYNVLALDEMDSTLDSRNRQSFIEVIESQLREMNVEQCFIISHNEAFDTYPVNLILFEGTNVDINDKEYMKNKKVLYQNK